MSSELHLVVGEFPGASPGLDSSSPQVPHDRGAVKLIALRQLIDCRASRVVSAEMIDRPWCQSRLLLSNVWLRSVGFGIMTTTPFGEVVKESQQVRFLGVGFGTRPTYG